MLKTWIALRKSPSFDQEKFITRGGFDVGTGNRVSYTIASVYPKQSIMRKQIFHNSVQLPPMSAMVTEGFINPHGVKALENVFFQIQGRMDEARMRPREMAAVVVEPFASAVNAKEVFSDLTKRFMIQFELANAAQIDRYAHIAYIVAAGISLRMADNVIAWTEIDDRVVFFRRKMLKNPENAHNEDVVQLFDDPCDDTTDVWDTQHTAQDVHDLILENYQRRTVKARGNSSSAVQSVNPMTAKEILTAVDDMTKALRQTMPEWMKEARKKSSANDRLFCGASANGGTINVLSRSCSRTNIDLYSARSNLYGPYVGVTDAFLSRSFPAPHLVLPRLITAHSLLNALDLRVLRYLPEMSLSFGVLLSQKLFSEPLTQDHAGSFEQMYFDRPWRAISHNPHVSQQIELPSDLMHTFNKRY